MGIKIKLFLFLFLLLPISEFANAGMSNKGLADAQSCSLTNDGDQPKVGQDASVYVGDFMVEQGVLQQCYEVKRTFEKGCCLGGKRQILEGGLLCGPHSRRLLDEKYAGFISGSGVNEFDATYAFEERKKGKVRIKAVPAGAKVADLTSEEFNQAFVKMDKLESDVSYPCAFQKRVQFMGKSGDTLNFRYSEYQDGLIREAFTQEFQLNLSDGNVGAFKGLVFEILNVTGASLDYKIVRHFP